VQPTTTRGGAGRGARSSALRVRGGRRGGDDGLQVRRRTVPRPVAALYALAFRVRVVIAVALLLGDLLGLYNYRDEVLEWARHFDERMLYEQRHVSNE